MRKICIILLSLCMMFTACVEENTLHSTGAVPEQKNGHTISAESAIGNMYSFIDKVYGATRSAGFVVKGIETVKAAQIMPATRAVDGTTIDEVLYVVNFENDGGFAILAADDRLPDEVIAVSESGQMSATAFDNIILDDNSNDYLTIPDSLYCVEDGDYYLGANADFVAGMTADYVEKKLNLMQTCAGKYSDNEPNAGEGSSGGGVVSDYDSGWLTDVDIPAKLKTKWHQRSPFNDQCPIRYRFKGILNDKLKPYDYVRTAADGEFIDSTRMAAGCIATAVAQILAYHKHPALNTIIVGDTLTWDHLTMLNDTTYSETPPTAYYSNVARLIHTIGVGCDMNYGFWGTDNSFSTPLRAKNYLEDIGYANTDRYVGYNVNRIIDMLNNDCPVLIGAISGTVDGHAWVIDGCIKRRRITGLINASGKVLNATTELQVHVHCNWGWYKGRGNGFYTSEMFDLTQPISIDADTTDMTHDFDHCYRMVTYNKPN